MYGGPTLSEILEKTSQIVTNLVEKNKDDNIYKSKALKSNGKTYEHENLQQNIEALNAE